jgi:hypothetical protein
VSWRLDGHYLFSPQDEANAEAIAILFPPASPFHRKISAPHYAVTVWLPVRAVPDPAGRTVNRDGFRKFRKFRKAANQSSSFVTYKNQHGVWMLCFHLTAKGDLMSDNGNPALHGLRRLNSEYEKIGDGLKDFLASQASGETPDPAEFASLLESQSVTKSAMQAQFNLLQKPLKTVLNESKN